MNLPGLCFEELSRIVLQKGCKNVPIYFLFIFRVRKELQGQMGKLH